MSKKITPFESIRAAYFNSGQRVEDHFVEANQMVEIRKGARRLPNGDRTQLARRSFKRRLGHRVLIPAPSPNTVSLAMKTKNLTAMGAQRTWRNCDLKSFLKWTG